MKDLERMDGLAPVVALQRGIHRRRHQHMAAAQPNGDTVTRSPDDSFSAKGSPRSRASRSRFASLSLLPLS
jgi:hypothetical protein